MQRAGYIYGGITLFLLFVIFCAMSNIVMKMCMGKVPADADLLVSDAAVEKCSKVPAFVLYGIIVGVLLTGIGLFLLATETVTVKGL